MTHHKSTSHSSKSKSKSNKSDRDNDRSHSSTMASSSSNAARGQQSYGSTYNDAGSFGNPRAAGAATSQQSSADYARTHPGVAYKPHQYGANATAAINRVNSQFPSSGHSQPSYYSPDLDFSDR